MCVGESQETELEQGWPHVISMKIQGYKPQLKQLNYLFCNLMQFIMLEMVLKLQSHAVQIWVIQIILFLPYVYVIIIMCVCKIMPFFPVGSCLIHCIGWTWSLSESGLGSKWDLWLFFFFQLVLGLTAADILMCAI